MAQRLSAEERARIEGMRAAGVTIAETARRLGGDPCTVWREIDRNSTPGRYGAAAAQAAAGARARRPKTPVLAADRELAAAVTEGLRARWSPHALSAELRAQGRRISAETIYAACYDHTGRRGLPGSAWRLLPRRCRRRKPRGRHTRKPRPLGDYRPIAERPAAAQRSEAGHRDGDLIIGAGNRCAVATLVERVSRQTLAVTLPHGYDARSTADAVAAALRRRPPHLVKTLTWDQGREMARWADIEEALDIKVYFCEPRSPQQRPTNEQTNGLLRRRLPKGTDPNIGAVRLAIIEDRLNTMPRKLHNWESAHSVYAALSRNDR